jgi:hypothetical protein
MYLEQLCTADNSTLLDWKHLSPRLLYLPKGRKPLWFSYLEDTILAHSYYRNILPHYQSPGHNPYAYHTINTSKKLTKSKLWLLSYYNDEIIIGKIRKYFPSSNHYSITHWTSNIDLNYTRFYPLPPVSYKQCTGCHLNSHRINQICTVEVSAIISAQFLGRTNSKHQLNLNANYLDLICSTAVKHPTHIPPAPNIPIINSIASEIFTPSESTNKLISISHHNLSYQQLSFYTDGSVIDIGTDQCTMGIGWIQVDNNNQTTNSFSAKIKFWPSSYKAELFSIISAISTAPRNCIINIFTDSQSVISKFNNL